MLVIVKVSKPFMRSSNGGGVYSVVQHRIHYSVGFGKHFPPLGQALHHR